MLNTAALVEHALKLADAGADRFGIVTSGTRPAPRELETVCEAVVRIRARTHLSPCASLGQLSPQAAAMLRQAGLERYHHNLETARSFFASVCTTQGLRRRHIYRQTWRARPDCLCAAEAYWGWAKAARNGRSFPVRLNGAGQIRCRSTC